MKTFFPGKICLCLLLAFPLIGMAQKHDFHFFPINGIEPRHQTFAGRIGSHFFLVDPAARPGLGLYIYDTASQQGISKTYVFPPVLSAVINKPGSILFAALQPVNNGSMFHLLEVNEKGEMIQKKDGALDTWKGPVNFVSSSDKKLLLFYQFKKRSSDTVVIKGFLLDDNGNVKKNILYAFKQNSDLDAEPELILDIFGNTHILVFDRFANYRLSTDLSVNTIPIADEQIVSETFNFEKIKLKNMRVFQNNECKCIQAEGMYVDGFGKGNKGIYSIAFPPGRKNELAPRFIPFNDDMIKKLKQGFSATDETIKNAIQLQEIIYSDSGSFAILKLSAGMPQQIQRWRPEEPSTKWANSASRGNDAVAMSNASVATSVGTTGVSRTTARMNSIPQGDRYAAPSARETRLASEDPPVSSKSYGRNAPKFICVKLEKENGFEWMQARPLDVFGPDFDIYNQLSLLTGEKKEISALLYQGDKLNQPYPVLVTIKEGRQLMQEIPEKKVWFSNFLFLDHHQYGSLYFNHDTGVGGLLVISSNTQ